MSQAIKNQVLKLNLLALAHPEHREAIQKRIDQLVAI